MAMVKYLKGLARFSGDIRGVMALEYGLIAALTAVLIAGSMTTFGAKINATFDGITGPFVSSIEKAK